MRKTLALPLAAALLAGCDFPGRPDPATRPVPADQVMDFRVLYQQSCAGCHGNEGRLGPAPPLNDPLFRAIVSEQELESIVAKGRKNTLMPAFAKENGGVLTAPQIQVLVKEIKGISYKIAEEKQAGATKVEVVPDSGGTAPKWGTPHKPPENMPPYRVVTADSAGDKVKGSAVFGRACAICHGSHGQGDGGETGPTINDSVFLALMSDQALRRYVITGRPDLGMPSFNEPRPDNPHFVPLTDQEVNDLVALLASWRREK